MWFMAFCLPATLFQVCYLVYVLCTSLLIKISDRRCPHVKRSLWSETVFIVI